MKKTITKILLVLHRSFFFASDLNHSKKGHYEQIYPDNGVSGANNGGMDPGALEPDPQNRVYRDPVLISQLWYNFWDAVHENMIFAAQTL